MNKLNLFQYSDYRLYLRSLVLDEASPRGYQSQMAKAAGCQPSYLSQVLSGQVQLTPDQALHISDFLKLDADSADYFIDLVNFDRSSTPKLREYYRAKLKVIKDHQLKISSQIKAKFVATETEAEYYSSWLVGAIHVILTIPGIDSAEKISERLKIPIESVQQALLKLRDLKFVSHSLGKWSSEPANLHAPDDSFFARANHANWRLKSLNDIQLNQSKGIRYTAAHSLSKKDAEKLKAMLLEFVSETRKVVEPSKEETVVYLCCDLVEL